VFAIDQNLLPFSFEIRRLAEWRETADAIRTMVVRGAPAIGVAGGYGMAQAFRESAEPAAVERALHELGAARPTARNLAAVVDRVHAAGRAGGPAGAQREAQRIADASVEECRAIGEHGTALIRDGARVLTHCNAGWLATVDRGTATAPLYAARDRGIGFHVLVDKTGPRDQGARLTAWELGQEGIRHDLIEESAAGLLMSRGEVDLVIVGADRIAANGDVANKVGTYLVALAAREHGVPFYVAAPRDTFDPSCASGREIPIEERSEEEVLFKTGPDEDGRVRRIRVAAPGAHARNPAFDVTPARLIAGIITSAGIEVPGDARS
jgi:methylthioribose-1-phosphate isomerase